MVYPVKLADARVTLREFSANDVEAALGIVGDDRVTQWLSFDSRDQVETAAMLSGVIERAQLQPRMEYYLGLSLDDASLIGFARLGLGGVRAAKLGYAVAADWWGHGYATDATRLMVEFGFRSLKLHRISAAIGPDNIGSIAVSRRLGMQYEGRLRDHVLTNGSWRDSLLYSILADEWPSPRPGPALTLGHEVATHAGLP